MVYVVLFTFVNLMRALVSALVPPSIRAMTGGVVWSSYISRAKETSESCFPDLQYTKIEMRNSAIYSITIDREFCYACNSH